MLCIFMQKYFLRKGCRTHPCGIFLKGAQNIGFAISFLRGFLSEGMVVGFLGTSKRREAHFGPFLPKYIFLNISLTNIYQLKIKDDLKAACIMAARHTEVYVELPKTIQRREDLDMELQLDPFFQYH